MSKLLAVFTLLMLKMFTPTVSVTVLLMFTVSMLQMLWTKVLSVVAVPRMFLFMVPLRILTVLYVLMPKIVCFSSSVGRAQGWKLWGRWFEPNLRHMLTKLLPVLLLVLLLSIFKMFIPTVSFTILMANAESALQMVWTNILSWVTVPQVSFSGPLFKVFMLGVSIKVFIILCILIILYMRSGPPNPPK